MIADVLAFILLGIIIMVGSVVLHQIRQNKQKIDKLEKSLDESLAELADVLLTRMEATERVIDSHYPNELKDNRKKIRLAEKRQTAKD